MVDGALVCIFWCFVFFDLSLDVLSNGILQVVIASMLVFVLRSHCNFFGGISFEHGLLGYIADKFRSYVIAFLNSSAAF